MLKLTVTKIINDLDVLIRHNGQSENIYANVWCNLLIIINSINNNAIIKNSNNDSFNYIKNLVQRIVKSFWYWYQLLKFWYHDNTNSKYNFMAGF